MDDFPHPAVLASLSKRQMSRLISRLEICGSEPDAAAFLDTLLDKGQACVLGLTGPPGVGKSTLTNALISAYRGQGDRVAVLAIDPSSQTTGGALLGDRTRLATDPEDSGVFVRSMAAGGRLGGLSDHALAVITLLRAAFDRVIIETVGTGQSEGDLVLACDSLCLCMQPGAGDSLQFMKAGIMELPHVIAVTKADLGSAARRTAADIAGALSLARSGGPAADGGWQVPVLEIAAPTGAGLERLLEALEAHRAYLIARGDWRVLRANQQERWLLDMIRQEFGRWGVAVFERTRGKEPGTPAGTAVFSRFRMFAARVKALEDAGSDLSKGLDP